ncbi:DUF4386 domain-containing protein [Granulicella sp. dw_53]|uniref:DUF4386 domain-containing protein n=1 Tax=Granulicella sp. dw_53 TaxID=2719792 RepID=UPI001BD4B792|nr:DUF4386 domain-containing protein [Granulicella sp. dw_53]
MIERIEGMSPRLKARVAGLLYLIVIAGGIFAELFVRGQLVVHGDAAATAHNIMTHELLYRLGFAVEIFYCACNVPLVLLFYDLFKVVNRSVAVLVVFFSLVGTAIESVSLLGHFAPLLLLGGGHSLNGFTAEQLQSLSYVSLQLFERGFAIALVFFGFYCLLFGYLIFRSTFFPRVIGVLLALEGVCYLINSFANFVAPAFAARFFSYLMVFGLAEVLLCGWLLVRGVNVERWREQAQRSAISIGE